MMHLDGLIGFAIGCGAVVLYTWWKTGVHPFGWEKKHYDED